MNKLFVGQVPNNSTEENVREVFAPYGTVSDVMFLKNKVTGQHRGCAFVTYETAEEAQAAIDAMNDKVTLEGAKRTMILRVAGQNRPASEGGAAGGDHKLYIGMLSKTTTVEELRTMFESYGIVLDAFLMHEKGDPPSPAAVVSSSLATERSASERLTPSMATSKTRMHHSRFK